MESELTAAERAAIKDEFFRVFEDYNESDPNIISLKKELVGGGFEKIDSTIKEAWSLFKKLRKYCKGLIDKYVSESSKEEAVATFVPVIVSTSNELIELAQPLIGENGLRGAVAAFINNKNIGHVLEEDVYKSNPVLIYETAKGILGQD